VTGVAAPRGAPDDFLALVNARVRDTRRLEAVRELCLDDSARSAFQRLTRLAAKLVGAPVALVNIVEADRQVTRGAFGDPLRYPEGGSAPLADSFCRIPAGTGAPFLVEDARVDRYVRDAAPVREADLVAYAGIPLTVRSGHALGALCVVDFHPRRWSEDELATLHDLAESVVTELELCAAATAAERRADSEAAARRQLQQERAARADAEASSRAKTQFLAVISHELRTPLNAINGYVQILEDGLQGEVNDAQRRSLARVKAAQRQLLGMIDDIIQLTQKEPWTPPGDRAPTRLEDALVELDRRIMPRAAAKGVAYQRDSCLEIGTVEISRTQLLGALERVADNAVKFTPAGGRVHVHCTQRGSLVAIHVGDTGPGIPVDRLSSVFEPFEQADSTYTRAHGGLGIGLAIATSLAKGMGGELTVESEEGRGATFTLRIPRGGDA
jgi:signal transduction histidine kinase